MMADSKYIVGIGSARASLESNHALRELVGEANFCNGMVDTERELHEIIINALQSDISTPRCHISAML